jgi:uncharacterized integral membrane protein (TIGR00698 family)
MASSRIYCQPNSDSNSNKPKAESNINSQFLMTLFPFMRPPHHATAWSQIQRAVPGILLSGILAFAAIELGKLAWMRAHGLSALTLAIVMGMLVGNTIYPRVVAGAASGVTFSKQNLLRLGIILYGLRLTMQDIAHVGVAGVLIDALVLTSTFMLALLLGTRLFKLDRATAILIGAGSSICGAAAVMATAPVVAGRAGQVTVAISTVVLFGTMAIFLYPALFDLNSNWGFIATSPQVYGIYVGSTIHEVAQVVAAAHAVGSDAADTAVIAKMVRVMMLAPFLIALSVFLMREKSKSMATHQHSQPTASGSIQALTKAQVEHGTKPKLTIPWFAFAFIGVVALNSFAWLPEPLVAAAIEFDLVLLAMAMAALGLTTQVSAIRQAGIKPLLLGATLFIWLIFGGAFINHMVNNFVH